MNNLIVLNCGVLTMTSREIAELTGKRHDNVMDDCRKLAAFYAETYSPEKSGELVKSTTYKDSIGRTLPCFELNKDASLDLVTGYSLPHRHAVNQRWQELEDAKGTAIPQTYAQALLEAGRLALQVEQQEAALALAAPKVQFVDSYVQASTGSLGFRQVCKLLGVKEPAFREFLLAEKIMYYLGGVLTAHQNHLDAGRFEVKTGVAGSEHAYSSTKFTPKGVTWVAGEWGKFQIRGVSPEFAASEA